jgi:hypothetical protein
MQEQSAGAVQLSGPLSQYHRAVEQTSWARCLGGKEALLRNCI